MEHNLKAHPSSKPKFTAIVRQTVRKPLERQCREGKIIGNPPEGVTLMNKKGEWGQNLPPKFTYEPEGQSGHRGQKPNKFEDIQFHFSSISRQPRLSKFKENQRGHKLAPNSEGRYGE